MGWCRQAWRGARGDLEVWPGGWHCGGQVGRSPELGGRLDRGAVPGDGGVGDADAWSRGDVGLGSVVSMSVSRCGPRFQLCARGLTHSARQLRAGVRGWLRMGRSGRAGCSDGGTPSTHCPSASDMDLSSRGSPPARGPGTAGPSSRCWTRLPRAHRPRAGERAQQMAGGHSCPRACGL